MPLAAVARWAGSRGSPVGWAMVWPWNWRDWDGWNWDLLPRFPRASSDAIPGQKAPSFGEHQGRGDEGGPWPRLRMQNSRAESRGGCEQTGGCKPAWGACSQSRTAPWGAEPGAGSWVIPGLAGNGQRRFPADSPRQDGLLLPLGLVTQQIAQADCTGCPRQHGQIQLFCPGRAQRSGVSPLWAVVWLIGRT